MAILVKRGDGALITIGIVILASGLFLWSLASPSPHGYIEVIFALPIICLGLLFIGGTLVAGHRSAKGAWFWIGTLTLLAAASPVLAVAGLVAVTLLS